MNLLYLKITDLTPHVKIFFISLEDNISNMEKNIFMVLIKISPLHKHNKIDRAKRFTFIAEALNSSSYGVT